MVFGEFLSLLKPRKGQSIMEYAMLLALVAAAFSAMTLYVKRAVQGQLNTVQSQMQAKPDTGPSYWVPPI